MRALAAAALALLSPVFASSQNLDKFYLDRMKEHEKVLRIKYNGAPKMKLAQTENDFVVSTRFFRPYYCPLDTTIYAGIGGIEAFDHESGHFFMDEVYRQMGFRNFPIDKKCNYISESHRAVAEGVATYFQIKMAEHSNRSVDFGDDEYTRFYRVVKSALDKDVTEGVIYFLRNFPTKRDMRDLAAYGRKAERVLSEKTFTEVPVAAVRK